MSITAAQNLLNRFGDYKADLNTYICICSRADIEIQTGNS